MSLSEPSPRFKRMCLGQLVLTMALWIGSTDTGTGILDTLMLAWPLADWLVFLGLLTACCVSGLCLAGISVIVLRLCVTVMSGVLCVGATIECWLTDRQRRT